MLWIYLGYTHSFFGTNHDKPISQTSILQGCQGTDEEASLGDRGHSGLNMEKNLRLVPCR